jgi:hypothetical protein
MSVEELEKAIAGLPADQLARLRAWFDDFMADEWDRQMARDAESGKLDKLVATSEEDFRAGRFREL